MLYMYEINFNILEGNYHTEIHEADHHRGYIHVQKILMHHKFILYSHIYTLEVSEICDMSISTNFIQLLFCEILIVGLNIYGKRRLLTTGLKKFEQFHCENERLKVWN